MAWACFGSTAAACSGVAEATHMEPQTLALLHCASRTQCELLGRELAHNMPDKEQRA